MTDAPACCFCGLLCEPWPGGSGWGNNPAPFGTPTDRCCNSCNGSVVIPERIRLAKRTAWWR